MTHLGWFVQSLKDRRIKISARDGGISINPHLRLKKKDIEFIKENREELIKYLQDPVDYELTQYAVNKPAAI